MTDIKMPDFEEWAKNTYGVYKEIQEALKQAFEQGRSLGRREAGDLWWKQIDKDRQEQTRLSELTAAAQPNIVQYLDRSSGCYIAINKITGKRFARKCGGKPFVNIPIVERA